MRNILQCLFASFCRKDFLAFWGLKWQNYLNKAVEIICHPNIKKCKVFSECHLYSSDKVYYIVFTILYAQGIMFAK